MYGGLKGINSFVRPGVIVGGGPDSCTAVHSTRKPRPPTTVSDWNSRVMVLAVLLSGGGRARPQNVPMG